MLKSARGIVAGLALAAVTAGQASATPWGGNGSYCGGNTFSTCFSIDMSWTAVTGTTVTVTLKLTNTDATSGLKWFSVGLDNLPAELSNPGVTPGYTGTGPNASWHNPPPNDFGGGPFVDFTASSVNNGGEAPGFSQRTWTFTFTSSASKTAAEWDALLQAAGVGLHAGGVLAGCSTKAVVRKSDGTYTVNGPDGSHPECEGEPPHEIVPEPMTMSLVALGLVMMGGAGLVRRRRKV